MKRLMLVAVAIGAAFLLSVCRGVDNRNDWDKIKDKEKNETSTLKIDLLHGTQCTLTEAPEQIRARWSQRVAFVLEGSCKPTDQITIGQFRPDAEPFDTITPVPAQDGQVLTVRVKPQGKKHHGLWHYEVLVNGTPIGVSGQGTQSSMLDLFDVRLRAATSYDFALCPSWPCNDF